MKATPPSTSAAVPFKSQIIHAAREFRVQFSAWFPLLLVLLIPAIMGMEGGEFLPAIYVVTNAFGGWLGARNGVQAMRKDLTAHVGDAAVHVHRRATDKENQ